MPIVGVSTLIEDVVEVPLLQDFRSVSCEQPVSQPVYSPAGNPIETTSVASKGLPPPNPFRQRNIPSFSTVLGTDLCITHKGLGYVMCPGNLSVIKERILKAQILFQENVPTVKSINVGK